MAFGLVYLWVDLPHNILHLGSEHCAYSQYALVRDLSVLYVLKSVLLCSQWHAPRSKFSAELFWLMNLHGATHWPKCLKDCRFIYNNFSIFPGKS